MSNYAFVHTITTTHLPKTPPHTDTSHGICTHKSLTVNVSAFNRKIVRFTADTPQQLH